MIRYFLLAFTLITLGCADNKPAKEQIQLASIEQLIPKPVISEAKNGTFIWTDGTKLDTVSVPEAYLLKSLMDAQTLEGNTASNQVILSVEPVFNEHPEAYELSISEDTILIKANENVGLMRGIQTLRQLLPPDFHLKKKKEAWPIPCASIKDYPAFQHRGMLLDVCRHFFEKEVVLKYIDALALYKMNVLHFHLTEDQGWRIAIDKYPKLNEISAWRTEQDGSTYGGFYTKEDLKEIVQYAAERHITVIPEIEMPGHSQAALAAYPQFSCEGGPIEVANDWGVFKEIYCAGNDSTFLFLEDVLTEVMEIFPSPFIHIGGDEAPKYRWEHCDKCQHRIKEEGLHDEHELQSYFIQRIEKFLNENGRMLIGWDEILEGGLSQNATVQSWRGMDGGKQAAEEGHYVIMSPTSHCYLDYSLKSIDLPKIYSFDPIPEDLNPDAVQYILGGECNMWTEHVPDEQNLDSKVFPRMIGLAEVLWSYPEDRDFPYFYERLQSHYPMLSKKGIDYGLETIGAQIQQDFSGDTIQIEVVKSLPDLELKYKWARTMEGFENYTSSIPLDRSDTLLVQAFKNGEPYGDEIKQAFEYHMALNKPVYYSHEWNQWYEGNGEKHLVDGKMGTLDFRDGNWQGFWGTDLDIVVDLGEVKQFNEVEVHFYQYANSWIFLPRQVTVVHNKHQRDALNWNPFMDRRDIEIDLSNEKSIHTFEQSYDINDIEARYIRLFGRNLGKVPEGHEAAGQDAWIFVDEIIVR